MKYIRTKDGVYELISDLDNKGYNVEVENYRTYKLVPKSTILAHANTIEELCDCFVYEKKTYSLEKRVDGSRYLDRYCLGGYDHHDTIDLDKAEIKCFEEFIPEHRKNTYGAIWTDKGLIYVAKMNEKGELELL